MKNGESKHIIICSNYAWTIFNFRMPLIKRLKLEGYRVSILTQLDGFEQQFINEVDDIYPLFISRKGINPLVDVVTLANIFFILLIKRPSLVFLFSIKPVIYGSIAARFLGLRSAATITGLGTAFIREGFLTKIVENLYRISLGPSSTVIFQNPDDKNLFVERNLALKSNILMSPGSGVDLETFEFEELSNGPKFTFLLVARLLWDKGIKEYVDAARIVVTKYPHARFQLLGPSGVQNHTAVQATDLDSWISEGVVEYLGETDDVRSVLREADCVVLPSYREGTPKSLLEAAAVGRPIIASDVPGCREVVEHNYNGLLCEARSASDLRERLEEMLQLSLEKRQEMGRNGRKKMEQSFSQELVCDVYSSVASLPPKF